jgi:DNA-binding transcriptional LysR family regulator
VGLGIAMVPECMTHIRLPRIRYVPIVEETDSRTLVLAHPRRARRQAALNLIELARGTRPAA